MDEQKNNEVSELFDLKNENQVDISDKNKNGFFNSYFHSLDSGRFFKSGFSLFLKVIAILNILGAFLISYNIWKYIDYSSGYSYSSEMSVSMIISILFFQLGYIIVIYVTTIIFFKRAERISILPDADFSVIPIISIIIKTFGEIYSTTLFILSCFGPIIIWIIGYKAKYIFREIQYVFPFLPIDDGFFAGIIFFIVGSVISFLIIAIFYLWAEILAVLCSIANNTKELIKKRIE